MKKRPWVIEEVSRNVHIVRYTGITVGELTGEFQLLLSDVHWDNPHCNRDLLEKHLNQALEYDCPVHSNGDLFCVMQGKYDKRSSKKDIRPEHQEGSYFDEIVNTAIDYFLPYSNILGVMGVGNHESSIQRHHEINLMERFVSGIKRENPDSPIRCGGYGGWIRLKYDLLHKDRGSHKIYYFHGSGGGGPVTKGVIQTNRRGAMITEADVIWAGHVHEQWMVNIPKIKLNDANIVKHVSQWHVSTPGYKEEYVDGYGGWHVERGAPPKPLGACWLEIYTNMYTEKTLSSGKRSCRGDYGLELTPTRLYC